MALKFQYNKTFLHSLGKDLKIRLNALPTLQAKEAALRVEVKNAKEAMRKIESDLKEKTEQLSSTFRLWTEFPSGLLSVSNVDIAHRKIAGVDTPVLEDVQFATAELSLFNLPSWIPGGFMVLRDVAKLKIEITVAKKKVEVLEYARKKTTQKVNLYQKVQIPEYQEAILKIKRFMEDEDNLAKSSQKILKERLVATEATA